MPPETTTQIDVSDIVLLTVKAALAPMLERIAAAEATITRATAHEPLVQDLRDRLALLEIKALGLSQVEPLRDRLVALEAKQGASVFVPTGPTEADLRTLADRLLVLETKGRDLPAIAPAPAVEFLAIRDRVSALEARAAVPGPPGHDGKDGTPGRDGAPGADGLGYDDLAVTQTDRSFTIKAIKGDREKVIGVVSFPVMEQKGIYQDGKTYEPGDVVTWSGSQWHCSEPTASKPGNGAKAWTLIVKCGRDGKDGRDAPSIPVVQMGGGRG
jgi:hypothetical protein